MNPLVFAGGVVLLIGGSAWLGAALHRAAVDRQRARAREFTHRDLPQPPPGRVGPGWQPWRDDSSPPI